MKRIFGLILLAFAIAGSVNFVKKISAGDTIKRTDNSAYDSGQKVGVVLVPVVLVGMGLLGLSLLFSSSDDRPAPPVRSQPIPRQPSPGDPSLRGGQNTFASNPARLRPGAGQWLAANPLVIIVCSSLAVIGAIVMLIKLPLGIVLIVTAGIVLFRQVQEAKQKFYKGDVCPGIVLSAQDNLVAVFTDLKAGSPFPQPAIKILKQPLRRITFEPAYDGMRVPTVALYFGNARKPAWKNFSPEVINCVVHDPEEIARVIGSIKESEWQALDTYLAQVPVARPGLYPLSGAFASRVESPQSQSEMSWAPRKPWFKTTPAIIGLSIFGAIAGLFLLLQITSSVLRPGSRHAGPAFRTGPPPPPPHPRPNIPRPWEPVSIGPYSVGTRVQTHWGGGWIPGKITSINPGGFSVMVQLDDSRFPYPTLFPTNQIQLK